MKWLVNYQVGKPCICDRRPSFPQGTRVQCAVEEERAPAVFVAARIRRRGKFTAGFSSIQHFHYCGDQQAFSVIASVTTSLVL